MSMMQMFLGAGATPGLPYFGNIGIWSGGLDKTQPSDVYNDVTRYVSIPTTSGATLGGDLVKNKRTGGGCSNGLRALYFGGKYAIPGGSVGSESSTIEYQTISTQSACSEFGDMTDGTAYTAGCSNGTRCVIGGGESPSRTEVIEFVVINTTGDAVDFGDLYEARHSHAALSNGTRGVFVAGAPAAGISDDIEYITIATNGDGTDLCDLNYSAYELTACGNRERALVSMGRYPGGPNRIEYISYFDPTSTSIAQDFGDLTVARVGGAAVNNETRAVFGGGEDSSDFADTIDYVTIASTGDATEFGDLATHMGAPQAASGD